MADRNLDNHRDCFISFFSFSSFGMQSSKEQELMYAVCIAIYLSVFCDFKGFCVSELPTFLTS